MLTNNKSPPNSAPVYVDVNIFLNPILYDIHISEEAKNADIFLKSITSNELIAYTSVLTWDEFVWIIHKYLDKEQAEQKGEDFLNFPNLIFLPVNIDVIRKAQDLKKKYNLKPRDAIHLASAVINHITRVITFDDDFKGIEYINSERPGNIEKDIKN
jgi:predicted nucleic acid-binding protein